MRHYHSDRGREKAATGTPCTDGVRGGLRNCIRIGTATGALHQLHDRFAKYPLLAHGPVPS